MKAITKKLILVGFAIYLICISVFAALNWSGGWFENPKMVDLRIPVAGIVAISVVVGAFFLGYCAFRGFAVFLEEVE